MSFIFMFSVGSLAMGFLPSLNVHLSDGSSMTIYGFNCLFNNSTFDSLILIFGHLLPLIGFVVSLKGAKIKHHKTSFFISSIITFLGAVIIICESLILQNNFSIDGMVSLVPAFGNLLSFGFAIISALINLIIGFYRN